MSQSLRVFICFNQAEIDSANVVIATKGYQVIQADAQGWHTPLSLFTEMGVPNGASVEDVVLHLGANRQAIPVPLPAGSTTAKVILATESI